MRTLLLFFFLSSSSICIGQDDEKVSIIRFIQILNDNYEEAIYYYQNNWKVYGEISIERGLMESFQILETPYSVDEPFHIIHIMTFKNKELYDNREEPLYALKKELGTVKLMNDKRPDEFRKILFTKRRVKHLNEINLDKNLIGHWRLDGNAIDNSSYGLNGKIIGNLKTVDGVLDGNAMEFNGNEFVEIDIQNQKSEHIKNLSSGSISLWFKASDWDVENSILPLLYYGGEESCNEKFSGDNTGMVVQIGHGGMFPSKSLFFTHYDKACATPALCFDTNNETGNIDLGKWYHFVGIVGEDYNTGYLNGEELINRHYNFNSDSTSVFFDDYLSHEKLWIGKSIWMNEEVYFKGLIDDVRIYNKTLSSDEVKELYNMKKLN